MNHHWFHHYWLMLLIIFLSCGLYFFLSRFYLVFLLHFLSLWLSSSFVSSKTSSVFFHLNILLSHIVIISHSPPPMASLSTCFWVPFWILDSSRPFPLFPVDAHYHSPLTFESEKASVLTSDLFWGPLAVSLCRAFFPSPALFISLSLCLFSGDLSLGFFSFFLFPFPCLSVLLFLLFSC